MTGRPYLVVLIRHAEKELVSEVNPPLSPKGVARAKALIDVLRNANVTAIVTTDQLRSRETAEPLADEFKIVPDPIPLLARSENIEEHVSNVVEAVRKRTGETVLVVGHTTTIPKIIRKLGGPAVPDISDRQFANLYVLVIRDGTVDFVASRYGAADP